MPFDFHKSLLKIRNDIIKSNIDLNEFTDFILMFNEFENESEHLCNACSNVMKALDELDEAIIKGIKDGFGNWNKDKTKKLTLKKY